MWGMCWKSRLRVVLERNASARENPPRDKGETGRDFHARVGVSLSLLAVRKNGDYSWSMEKQYRVSGVTTRVMGY